MTRKLTRDIIQSEIADFFAGVVEIHTELGGPNTVEEAQNQLIERVLACVPEADSEPVAWTDEEELRDANAGACGYLFGIGCSANKFADLRRQIMLYRHAQPGSVVDNEPYGFTDGDRRGMIYEPQYADRLNNPLPVYRHAQQPVVPDDVLEALQKVARIRLDLNDFDGDRRGIVDCLGDAEEALIEVVNRRADMLAASPQLPGSEPATVPGKWIPVSERMPEEGGRYWCYVEEQNSLGKSHYQWNCSWNGDVWSDNALTGRVTHWMPLPAGPKEDIKALIPLVSRNEQEGK